MLHITPHFKAAFENEHIQIILKDVHAYIIEKDDDGSVNTRGSAIMEGLFIDYDDYFLYLGNDKGQIETAVALNLIASVSLVETITLTAEQAKFFSLPDGDEDIN